jgi:hypothetical protein
MRKPPDSHRNQQRYAAPNPYNAEHPNPFQGTGGRGSLFRATCNAMLLPVQGSGPGALGMGCGAVHPTTLNPQSLQNIPAAQRHADLLQHVLVQHPNTAEGQIAYQVQVAAWHTANPHRKPDEQHQYPLRPGTTPVGS